MDDYVSVVQIMVTVIQGGGGAVNAGLGKQLINRNK
jgi:hypothetical protein